MSGFYNVNVPVTNLRNTPSISIKKYAEKDEAQESQLLYNEKVRLISKENEWAFIEALEQPHKGPSKYRGWVPCEHLVPVECVYEYDVFVTSFWADVESRASLSVSFGTGFKMLTQTKTEIEVLLPGGEKGTIKKSSVDVETETVHARKFLGTPYLWGGRSAFDDKHQEITGVDCSGLISLVYRVKGINLPRNAIDQWKVCSPISSDMLKEGDLVFSSSNGGEEKIDHVMLACGDGNIIEAAMGVGKVHELSLAEKRKRFPNDEFFFGRL